MLVDDVITAGTAIRESMEIIRARGAQLAGVLISPIVRNAAAARSPPFRKWSGITAAVISIITLKELITYLEEKPEMAEHGVSSRLS